MNNPDERRGAAIMIHIPTKELSERDLEIADWHKFNWNGGIIREYWKSLNESDPDDFSYRIGVRFNERKDRDFMVWIIVQNSHMTPAPKVRNFPSLDTLHLLLLRNLKEYI